MTREVRVRIGERGRIETDFHGFVDDDCFDEADRLAEALRALGLSVELRERRVKPAVERRLEAGEPLPGAGAAAEGTPRAEGAGRG
ncbi:MAG: hypothetical protein IMW98_00360 [Firmicutes bacterium]|nr:hypothetical protein [Bacillota bacterium]